MTDGFLAGLRPMRKAAGLTQAQLARTVGTSKECIRAWELGLYWLSAAWLPALATALQCQIEQLYEAEEDGAP